MALDGEVGGQSSSLYGALGQATADEVHGVARRHRASVVADDRHAVADVIVAPGVCSEVAPAPAFVDVAVRADHKAEHNERFVPTYIKVQFVIFGDSEEDTATTSGPILDCGVVHSLSPSRAYR